MKTPIVDVHIEKTAGRSKRKLLLDAYGSDRVMHYNCASNRFVRADKRLIKTETSHQEKLRNTASNRASFPIIKMGFLAAQWLEGQRGIKPEELPNQEYDVVTGHITGSHIAQYIKPEESTYTSVLREPMNRAYSHFLHWQRTRGLAQFKVMPKYDDTMSFQEFALLPEMHNYQTRSLDIDPGRFAVIGVWHALSDYFEELNLKQPNEPIPHLNQSPYGSEPVLDRGFIAEFQAINAEDYRLFESVSSQWDRESVSIAA